MDVLVQLLGFPSSALLAVSFLLASFAMHYYAYNAAAVSFLRSSQMAKGLLAIGAIMLAIEGTWSVPIHNSAPFAIYVLILMLSLSLTVLNGIRRKAKVGFLLNHAGILLIIWAAFFGAPDVTKCKMMVSKGQDANMAYAADGMIVPLPFHVSLNEFRIDYYDDGISPKQFTSKIIAGGEIMETAVNSPCSHKGYTIYQDSYDRMEERYTVLQLVRDPWLPIIYIGMVLLAAGSLMLLFSKWKTRVILPATIIVTLLFTALTVAKINFGTLMPALRSWWFVPHLFIYMVAYSLMAIALVIIVVKRISKKDNGINTADNLIRSSSALLIIGMLTGSVWARQAWGDYWAWDPKENWAAVTWFVTLLYLHLRSHLTTKALITIILAFVALQITWYGVNYLPSAINSMHTYNN